jgi:hypothetical protein
MRLQISNKKIIFIQVLKIKLLKNKIIHSVNFKFDQQEMIVVTILSLQEPLHCFATRNKVNIVQTRSEIENDFVHGFEYKFQMTISTTKSNSFFTSDTLGTNK